MLKIPEESKTMSLAEKVGIIRHFEQINHNDIREEIRNATHAIRLVLLNRKKILEQYNSMQTRISAVRNVSQVNYASNNHFTSKFSLLERILVEWYQRSKVYLRKKDHHIWRQLSDEKIGMAMYLLEMNSLFGPYGRCWQYDLRRSCLKGKPKKIINVSSEDFSLKEILKYVLQRDYITKVEAQSIYGLRAEAFEDEEDQSTNDKNTEIPDEDSELFYSWDNMSYDETEEKSESSTQDDINSDNWSHQQHITDMDCLETLPIFDVPISKYEEELAHALGLPSQNNEDGELSSKIPRRENQKDVHENIDTFGLIEVKTEILDEEIDIFDSRVSMSNDTSVAVEVKSEPLDEDNETFPAINDMQSENWTVKEEPETEEETKAIFVITEIDEHEAAESCTSNLLVNVKNESETEEIEDVFELYDVINDEEDDFEGLTSPEDIIPESPTNLEPNAANIESNEYDIFSEEFYTEVNLYD